MKRHTWDELDDIALYCAIDDAGALRPHYEGQGYSQAAWWDAVAGALHKHRPEVTVTGSACRRRWERLEQTPGDVSEPDAWAAAATVVAAWEAKATDRLVASIGDCITEAHELGLANVVGALEGASALLELGALSVCSRCGEECRDVAVSHGELVCICCVGDRASRA